jgi:hypothetical protein
MLAVSLEWRWSPRPRPISKPGCGCHDIEMEVSVGGRKDRPVAQMAACQIKSLSSSSSSSYMSPEAKSVWTHYQHDGHSNYVLNSRSQYFGVGIAQWYSAGLRVGWSGVRVPAWARNFSLHHRVQTGCGAHPASYKMGSRGSFPGGEAAGAWSWLPCSAEVKNAWSYTSPPQYTFMASWLVKKSTRTTLPLPCRPIFWSCLNFSL